MLKDMLVTVACAIAAALLVLWIFYELEILISRQKIEVVAKVVSLDRATGRDDHPGHIALSIDGDVKKLSFEVNPKAPVRKGDVVRAVYRDNLLGQEQLLRLDVISGSEPGPRLNINKHKLTWSAMWLVIFAVILTVVTFVKGFRLTSGYFAETPSRE